MTPGAPLLGGRGSLPPAAIAWLQRARILDATARVVAADGYAHASVAAISARAGVSRRTYYAHFRDKEDAVVAAFDAAAAYALPRLLAAFRGAPDWAGGIDAAVNVYLALTGCDPAWATLCVLELPGAGRRAMAHRDDALRRLSEELGPSVDLQGIIAALDAQLRPRLTGVARGGEPQYIRDAGARAGRLAELLEAGRWGAVRGELERARTAHDGPVLWRALVLLGQHRTTAGPAAPADLEPLILSALPAASFFGLPLQRISRGEPGPWSAPSTALRCLRYVHEHPGTTAGELRAGVGIAHLSTITRQLNRIAEAGLVTRGERRGPAHRWRCTEAGDALARRLT